MVYASQTMCGSHIHGTYHLSYTVRNITFKKKKIQQEINDMKKEIEKCLRSYIIIKCIKFNWIDCGTPQRNQKDYNFHFFLSNGIIEAILFCIIKFIRLTLYWINLCVWWAKNAKLLWGWELRVESIWV